MDFALPPEITSTLIYTGPGSAPLAAASAAWGAVASELEQFIADHTAIIGELNTAWLGPSDMAMRAASFGIISWAQQTAAQAAQMAASAASAAAAFEVVHSTVTPPAAVFANRAQLMHLIATNILGQNFPAIAATEAQYAQMWATNTTSMAAYQTASAQATSPLTAFQGLLSDIPGLGSIIAPGSNQSTTGLAGILNLLSGSTGSSLGTFLNGNFLTTGLINSAFSSGFYMPSQYLYPAIALQQADYGNKLAQLQLNQNTKAGADETPISPESGGGSESTNAAMGRAGAVGALRVPPGWTSDNTTLVSKVSPLALGEPIAPTPGQPGFPGVPIAATTPRNSHPGLRYGVKPTIMQKQPYGG